VASEALKRLHHNLTPLKKIKVFSPQLCLNAAVSPRIQQMPLFLLKGRDLAKLESQCQTFQVNWMEAFQAEVPGNAKSFWFGVSNYKDMLNRRLPFNIAQEVLSVSNLPISSLFVEY
jgi:hypothetical protein